MGIVHIVVLVLSNINHYYPYYIHDPCPPTPSLVAWLLRMSAECCSSTIPTNTSTSSWLRFVILQWSGFHIQYHLTREALLSSSSLILFSYCHHLLVCDWHISCHGAVPPPCWSTACMGKIRFIAYRLTYELWMQGNIRRTCYLRVPQSCWVQTLQ